MRDEAVAGLHIKKLGRYIDATLGNGGHALGIIKLGGHVLGIDIDPKMIEISDTRLSKLNNFKLVRGNFKDIDRIASENEWTPVDGILFDLGVSNIHLKDLERGFSFENPDASLDMRLDPSEQGVKAYDLLNVLREDQLTNMFEVTLDPGPARWITSRVISARENGQITKVGEMQEICKGLKTGRHGLNEATLPFLALRIAVNSELENLKTGLTKSFGLLKSGGRIVVISFHSKEDEIVKDFFKEKSLEGKAELITFKPVKASDEEVEKNRRARSAKMRVLQKIK
jgi:16S rRNA (cytosine1402-N4)-methyltransferase